MGHEWMFFFACVYNYQKMKSHGILTFSLLCLLCRIYILLQFRTIECCHNAVHISFSLLLNFLLGMMDNRLYLIFFQYLKLVYLDLSKILLFNFSNFFLILYWIWNLLCLNTDPKLINFKSSSEIRSVTIFLGFYFLISCELEIWSNSVTKILICFKKDCLNS